jgi:CBS domain-containing protein
MRNWSIPAGRIFGVELRIHLTFFFLLIFVWLTESTAHGAANAGRGLALVGIIFGSVVLHELGHALVSMRAGIPAKAIILLPIGGVTLLDETQRPLEPGMLTWKRDIRIAVAGPLVNILIAAVAAGVLLAVAPQIHLWTKPYVYSGNLPRSLVWAQLEERSAVFQSVLETVRLEDIMLTDFATLSPADTLEDALEKAVHSLQDDFPVIRGSDMVGVISKQKILAALRAEGNGYVQAVMNRIFEVAQKKESLASAFRKLTARNLSIIPVVEDERLIGIVTLQNLMHSMALLAESRKLRKAALNS